MSSYTELFESKTTPQSSPIPGREPEMVKNYAGGYTFQIDAEAQLKRFLILGADSATYYASAQKMTADNSQVVMEYAAHEPAKCAGIIADISKSGRAMRNDAAIFALALMAERVSPESRMHAFAHVNQVCRTGSMFMLFNRYLEDLGGKSNRSRRTMITNWYKNRDAGQIAYQSLKYRNRYGWKPQDLINVGHVITDNADSNRVIEYLMTGRIPDGKNEQIVFGFEEINEAKTEKEVVAAIDKYKLTWEFVPSRWLESNTVWETLLPNMPYTATIRNLGQLTARGIIAQNSDAAKWVCNKLNTAEYLRYSRVHPFTILVAQRIYMQGQGMRGSKSWNPVSMVTDALEDAFYSAFDYVEPSGKSYFFGIDASGSVGMQVSQHIPMAVGEAEAVMAMVAARTEKNSVTEAFASGRVLNLNITRHDSLHSAVEKMRMHMVGSTDLAAPMKYSRDMGLDIDCFVIMTDNETWSGSRHPVQELAKYREWKKDPNVGMIVAAFTSTGFSIADPTDPRNLDIVGMDTQTPQLISSFGRGEW